MKVREIFICSLCVFLVNFFLKMGNAFALSLDTKHSGYYFERSDQDSNNYSSWYLDYYTIDNQVAYCIEPGIYEGEGLTEGKWSDTNLPERIRRTVLLIAYYGYTYPGHNTEKYRAATQALIWEAILENGTKVTFSSERYGKGTIYDVEKEKQEIQRMVNHHYDKPSFQNQKLTIQVGKKISLVDNNQVLSNYTIASNDHILVENNDNTLNLTPLLLTDTVLKFTKKNKYSTNYKVFYSSKVQNMLVPGNIEQLTFDMPLTSIYGTVSLKKYDSETTIAQGSATLEGAQYGVYRKADNELVTVIITDKNGNAKTERNLPYDQYYIKELKSSIGYQLDDNIYSVEFDENGDIHVDVAENVIKGTIRITKVDKETQSCNSIGEAILEGATYGIYNSKEELVETVIIQSDCTAISKPLPFDTYTVKELYSSTGYQLDATTYDVFIEGVREYTVLSKEPIIKNEIIILKQAEYIDGNSGFLSAEEDIIFAIYGKDGNLYKTVSTDKNGYAFFELPYGEWRVHQVNVKEGYEKINDFFITVDANSLEKRHYNILNNKMAAYLQIYKMDAETKKPIALANTSFRIMNMDTNTYVSQYIGGKECDTFKTDATGRAMTYLKLEAGNYKLVEIKAPKGYLLNREGLTFTIGEDTDYVYTKEGMIATVYFTNFPIKGKLEILKKGEILEVKDGKYYFSMLPLEGIEYGVYAEEVIQSSDGNHIYYHKGELVDVLVTANDGYARSKLLSLGKYYLKEIKTRENYILSEKIYRFSLTQEKDTLPIVKTFFSLNNTLKKGSIELTKVDLKNGSFIPGTKISLFTIDDELLSVKTTDAKGRIKFENLPCGEYYIQETEASLGYILQNEKKYFEIKENNDTIFITLTNEKVKATVIIHKIDNNQKSLQDVEIGIYNEKGDLIFSDFTDENGDITADLEYGRYYYQEIGALDSYLLDTNKYYFDVIGDNPLLFTLINEKEVVEIPNTYKNRTYLLEAISIFLTIFYLRRKYVQR